MTDRAGEFEWSTLAEPRGRQQSLIKLDKTAPLPTPSFKTRGIRAIPEFICNAMTKFPPWRNIIMLYDRHNCLQIIRNNLPICLLLTFNGDRFYSEMQLRSCQNTYRVCLATIKMAKQADVWTYQSRDGQSRAFGCSRAQLLRIQYIEPVLWNLRHSGRIARQNT